MEMMFVNDVKTYRYQVLHRSPDGVIVLGGIQRVLDYGFQLSHSLQKLSYSIEVYRLLLSTTMRLEVPYQRQYIFLRCILDLFQLLCYQSILECSDSSAQRGLHFELKRLSRDKSGGARQRGIDTLIVASHDDCLRPNSCSQQELLLNRQA